MSELDIEIRERTAARQTPAEIAKALDIPAHWVAEIISEIEYTDYMDHYGRSAADEFFAEQQADADAEQYGNR